MAFEPQQRWISRASKSHLAGSHYRHHSWPLEVSGLAVTAHTKRSVASVLASCLRSARDLKLNNVICLN